MNSVSPKQKPKESTEAEVYSVAPAIANTFVSRLPFCLTIKSHYSQIEIKGKLLSNLNVFVLVSSRPSSGVKSVLMISCSLTK